MKNKIFIIALAIALVFITFKGTTMYYNSKLADAEIVLKKEKIKNDSLYKINSELYTKLVADTLSEKELNKVIDSLKLKLKNPEIIIQEVLVIKEIEKEVDGVILKDSTLLVEDYYPDKETSFVTYTALFDLKEGTGNSKFSFKPIKLSLGIGQNKDGTYSLNSKVPEFIEVTSLDVSALPMEEYKEDHFGFLVGVGAGIDFTDSTNFLELNAGIRINKFYLGIAGTTQGTVTGGVKVEF